MSTRVCVVYNLDHRKPTVLSASGAQPTIGAPVRSDSGAAGARVRRSAPVTLGLAQLAADGGGGVDLQLDWQYSELIAQGLVDEEKLVDAFKAFYVDRARAALAALEG